MNGNKYKCGLCQTVVAINEPLARCRSCDTVYHQECLSQLGGNRCATAGCGRARSGFIFGQAKLPNDETTETERPRGGPGRVVIRPAPGQRDGQSPPPSPDGVEGVRRPLSAEDGLSQLADVDHAATTSQLARFTEGAGPELTDLEAPSNRPYDPGPGPIGAAGPDDDSRPGGMPGAGADPPAGEVLSRAGDPAPYELTGSRFRGWDLAGKNLHGIVSRHADFKGADLSGADLSQAELSGAVFTRADLTDARLSGARLVGAGLRHANLAGADLTDADLRGSSIRMADLRGATLRRTVLDGATLTASTLEGADLEGASLRRARLDATGPEGTIMLLVATLAFSGVLGGVAWTFLASLLHVLIIALLPFAALTILEVRARLTGRIVPASLEGAGLNGADLTGAKMYRVNLRGASLRGADLSYPDSTKSPSSAEDGLPQSWSATDLRRADLTGADLRGADLSTADLRKANLSAANLTDARLCNARLEGALMEGAMLDGADLSGATGLKTEPPPGPR